MTELLVLKLLKHWASQMISLKSRKLLILNRTLKMVTHQNQYQIRFEKQTNELNNLWC